MESQQWTRSKQVETGWIRLIIKQEGTIPSTIFQKNVILKDNVLDRDIFLLWSITHKRGLSVPGGILYKSTMTFRTGDKTALREARNNFTAGINRAKATYSQWIQEHLKTNDFHQMWKRLKDLTDYRSKIYYSATVSDPFLLHALNSFFAHFEENNSTASMKIIPPADGQVLSLTTTAVKRTLQKVNPRKATVPDGIPGRELKKCSSQLTDLASAVCGSRMPQKNHSCTKKDTNNLLYYHPVAITSIIMKCLERLVMTHIKTIILPTLDPLQFAYRQNNSTADAISHVIHLTLGKQEHLCQDVFLLISILHLILFCHRNSSENFMHLNLKPHFATESWISLLTEPR